ncbi:hypothetical protein [Algoriphagus sp. A40]|uniref:hypothetical protein n=1 Tax=Algoriphagus sp. A40 TaxID=1945863 RepID=UPI001115607B|nr:hypothetical protein [Algoriphagus sp. A40]
MKFIQSKSFAFWIGALFLFGYWLFGFDGITFSDDVFYLLAGKSFWEGSMEFNSYHFSTRWGAYVPSGLIGFLIGFDPHKISLISLVSYLGTLALLLRILPKSQNPWILLVWFSSQIYFLHFLTKVYPDSLLVFWIVLVPFSAIYRQEKPFLSALGVISGLLFGFLTKETIVFLGLLPILLFWFDWKKGNKYLSFYFCLIGLGIAFGTLYLGYFWIKFGSPFYRFESIQDGHYISEFTYADKSFWVMLKRLTIMPIVTFVERSYWLWLVFAIPGLVKIRKKPQSPGIEFGLAFFSLLVCFWLMSTNFKFYNPIYLNPRHLIIFVPILAFLISLGWEYWQADQKLKRLMAILILFGAAISLLQQDWKMAGFQALAILILYAFQGQKLTWAIGIYLLVPGLLAIRYQQNLKEYPLLIKALIEEVKSAENQSLILTNNFLDFSKGVLFYEDRNAQKLLFPIEKLDSIRALRPTKIRVILYDYYRHAYPKEQEDVDILEPWLLENYILNSEETEGQVWIRTYSRK